MVVFGTSLHACHGDIWRSTSTPQDGALDTRTTDATVRLDGAIDATAPMLDGAIDAPTSNQPVATLRFSIAELEIGTEVNIALPLVALDANGEPTSAPVDISFSNGNATEPRAREVRGTQPGETVVTARANGHSAMLTLTIRQGYREIRSGFKHSCGLSPTGELFLLGMQQQWRNRIHTRMGRKQCPRLPSRACPSAGASDSKHRAAHRSRSIRMELHVCYRREHQPSLVLGQQQRMEQRKSV